MRTLAIETATIACSVALFDGEELVAAEAATVGRGHAERLLPMIAALPDGGRADAIWVDCGPGSFTGIRVGIAAARGLGFGWKIPVSGFSSMALIAATWFARCAGDDVTVVIEGGHGELFVQPFARHAMHTPGELASVKRELAAVEGACADDVAPDARNALLLTEATLFARPIYGRAPDALPMAS